MRLCVPIPATVATFAFALLLAPAAASEAGAGDRAFADKVQACEAATHQSPHPLVRGFTIDHAVTGEADGLCGYRQSMPGGMHMECALSEDGRAGLAHEFREMAEGRMSGSTKAQVAWTSECEIVTADGKRMKLGA